MEDYRLKIKNAIINKTPENTFKVAEKFALK